MKRAKLLTALLVVSLLLPVMAGCGGGGNEAEPSEAVDTEPVPVLIEVTPLTAEVATGSRLQYLAAATYSDSSTKSITDIVEWASTDSEVVVLDASGQATAQAEGDVTITATLEGISGSALLDVISSSSTGTFLSVNPQKASLETGQSMQFQATQNKSDGTAEDVSTKATWSSSAPAVAAVDSTGKAQALGTGTATVTASLEGLIGFAMLTVSETSLDSLESLSILPVEPDLQIGRSMQFCAVANFAGNVQKVVTTEADWKSSNQAVAIVGATGLVVAEARGDTSISASWEGEVDSTVLRVVESVSSITVTDSMDNEVELPYPVKRIASFNPAATEILWALGAEDRIVGIDMYSKWNKEFFHNLNTRPSIGIVPMMPDYEKIISLRPDVVIAYVDPLFNYPHLEDKMESAGIEVLRLDLYKPDTFTREVALLGQILDRENLAEEYVDYAVAYVQQIEDRVKSLDEDEKVDVYYEWFTPYVAYGEGTGGYQLIERAGGRDIYSREGGELLQMPGYSGEGAYYSMMSPEWIVEQNPDVIIKDYMNIDDYMAMGKNPLSVGYTSDPSTSEMERARNEMMNRPGFSALEAVQNGDVYTTPFCGICLSPRWSVALGYMAKWFYPELFEDLDPQAFHAEWLQKWHGLEYQGIFFYPETS